MATIKLSAFSGMVPAIDDRLLPVNNASFAQNAWLYSGAISAFNRPKTVYTAASTTIGKVYRIPNQFTDAEHIQDSIWLEFQEADTDIIKSSVVGDVYDRYYFAAAGVIPKYNTKQRIDDDDPAFYLGVPAPTVAPGLTHAGGTGSAQTRSYVITYLSAYSEEGPPSPPVTVTGRTDGTWTLTWTPYVDANRNITSVRIYRTVTSSQGVTSYFFVTEVPMSPGSYADTALDAAISSNDILGSSSWFPPPSDLEGWVTLPNGIIAGWREQEIWFSEAYRPHAWPPEYALSVEYNIVGLGVYGQTLIVCTEGYPSAITGINPASMSMAKISSFEPCVSRGSIVSAPEGVYYASPNGLILAAQGQFNNVTKAVITKDKWQELVSLSTFRAARLGSAYYAWGTARLGMFEPTAFDADAFEQSDYTGAYNGIFVDPTNLEAISTLYNPVPVTSVFNDPWSGEVFTLRNGSVEWIDVTANNTIHETALWRSKVFQTDYKQNFQAAKVFFSVPENTPADPVPVDITTSIQQLGKALYSYNVFSQVYQAIPILGGAFADFYATETVSPNCDLGAVIHDATGFTSTQMTVLWNVANSYPTPTVTADTVSRYQLFTALVSQNVLYLIYQGLIIDTEPYVEFYTGQALTKDGALGSFIQTELSYTAGQMTNLWAVAKAIPDRTTIGAEYITRNQLFRALREQNQLDYVYQQVQIDSLIWVWFYTATTVIATDTLGTFVKNTLSYTDAEMAVLWDLAREYISPPAVINNNLVQTYSPTAQYGLVRFYADDELIATRELRRSGDQLRLPSGFKSDYWQVEFEGTVHVYSIQIATSAKELRAI
jgi:hypothetical protein